MGELSPWHLLILAAVFVVLFGSRKLPDAARALGRSMRIFKAETKGLRDGGETTDEVRQVQPTAVQQPAAVQQPTVQQAPAPPESDGTIVSGAPLAEAQRNQQST